MNSFRSIHRAIETEIERQSKMLNAGEEIVQETRGFVDAKGITVSQRSKEQAHDYRYFPEPDLPPLFNSDLTISNLKTSLKELPNIKSKRFEKQYGLLSEESELLASTKQTADNFEESVKEYQKLLKNNTEIELAKTVANWYMGDIAKQLNQISPDAELQDTQVSPRHISELLQLIHKKQITVSSAKVVLEKMFNNEGTPSNIVDQEGLGQLNNTDAIIEIILNVIKNNEKAIGDYNSGKTSALGYLVGQVMKETRGRIDANEASQLLIKKISEKK
jgi:aspartyl-tRNA(Asn)/glutamyl-tRNA(Gln) amidotransferase subunit B